MSGGYIKPQKPGEHQIVVFTFTGGLHKTTHVEKWNKYIHELKTVFSENLTGITLKGDPTPPRLLRAAKKTPKKKK